MNIRLGLSAALLGASLMVGGAAGAATTVDLTYNFAAGSNQEGYTLSYSSGGVGLDVTGYLYTAPDTITAQAKVYSQNQNGLGVCGDIISSSTGNCTNDKQLDGGAGDNDNEVLKFTFAKSVSLVSIEFNQNDQNDIFDFFLGEPLDFKFATNTPLPPNRIYTFAEPYPVGTTFGIGIRGNSDEVRIAGLTVRYEVPCEVTNSCGGGTIGGDVPLPAGLPLLLSGVGVMAFVARRKARKA